MLYIENSNVSYWFWVCDLPFLFYLKFLAVQKGPLTILIASFSRVISLHVWESFPAFFVRQKGFYNIIVQYSFCFLFLGKFSFFINFLSLWKASSTILMRLQITVSHFPVKSLPRFLNFIFYFFALLTSTIRILYLRDSLLLKAIHSLFLEIHRHTHIYPGLSRHFTTYEGRTTPFLGNDSQTPSYKIWL